MIPKHDHKLLNVKHSHCKLYRCLKFYIYIVTGGGDILVAVDVRTLHSISLDAKIFINAMVPGFFFILVLYLNFLKTGSSSSGIELFSM